MCGIAGFVSRLPAADPTSVSVRTVRKMMNAIRHRGPDDSGTYHDSFAAVGHLRLSIVDLSAGHQPMFNETGGLAIVFNGEIYNHASLRPPLERAGHVYRSHSDTETILHAYEEYGEDCVAHFRGMFAFSIWDSTKQRLFCARDRLGVKPFYYYFDGRLFAFASEIKALLEHPAIGAHLESSLLPEYLSFGYVSGDRTLFRGIRKLMPGYRLTLNREEFEPRIERYWQVPTQQEAVIRPDLAWIHECRELLEESVRLRLMADVPLGVFLSGGLDSSSIAALMQRMTSERVRTFAVGYRERESSELGYARAVAEHIGTDHHEVVVGMDEFFNTLPELVWHEDEPLSWPSSVSLYHVSTLAAKDVKVVLTGEGSDELFAGYGRYSYQLMSERHMEFYRLVPAALRNAIRDRIDSSGLLGAELRRKLKHTVLGRTDTLQSLYLENFYSPFTEHEIQQLLGRKVDAALAYRPFLNAFESAAQLPYLERMLYADKQTYLVELLMKQDQMSMAASVESRVPFLDHHLVEFASRVPAHLKLRGKSGKYILKEAMAGLLPAEIVNRKKMGFPTPLKRWLHDTAAAPVYDFLLQKDSLLSEFLERKPLQNLLARHRSGAEDATDRVWNLLNLQLWGDIFFKGKRVGWEEGMFASARHATA